MERELFCCLCDREYTELNLPRMFPACGHTYCENCIKNLMGFNRQREVRIVCPQDHIQMKFEDRDINHFPKNISLVKLMGVIAGTALKKKSSELRAQPEFEEVESITLKRKSSQPNKQPANSSSISIKTKSVVSQDTLNEEDMCLAHQKALQVICIQHRTLICSSCAIFGEHKGHDFKSVKDMDKDKMHRQRSILDLIDRKEAIIQKEMSQERRDQEQKRIQHRKDILMQQLRVRYSKLYEMIKFSQRKSIEKLNKFFGGLDDKLKNQATAVQKAVTQYKDWEERAMKEVDSYERANNLQQQIVYLGYDNDSRTGNILSEGDQIVKFMQETLRESNNMYDDIVDNVQLTVNQEVDKGLIEYVGFREKRFSRGTPEIRKVSSLTHIPSLRQFRDLLDLDIVRDKKPTVSTSHMVIPAPHNEQPNEEMLLETERSKILQKTVVKGAGIGGKPNHAKSPSNVGMSQMSQIIYEQSNQENRELKNMLRDSPGRHDSKNNLRATFSSPRSKDFLSIGSGIIESPRRRNKLKLPDKYEKVLDSILTESTDTADFTGAELGNDTISQILELIKSKKIKTLKLIRNKLNDDMLDTLWHCMSNVHVLNLSQNQFTDRILESFINNMSKAANLKSLVISQNKINARNIKGRVDELKRLDITVTL